MSRRVVAILLVVLVSLVLVAGGCASATSASDTKADNSSNTVLVQWIAALGSVGVALSILWLEILRPRLRAPRFDITFDNAEPFCQNRFTTYDGQFHLWVRLRVKNKGKSVARNCEGKLTQILDCERRPLMGHDPAVLHWAVVLRGGSWDYRPIDINRGEEQYLDVLHVSGADPDTALLALSPAPMTTVQTLSRGTYYLGITIYGDNVAPLSRLYRVEWDGEDNDGLRMYEERKGK